MSDVTVNVPAGATDMTVRFVFSTPAPTPAGQSVEQRGIDVSRHQGRIDWAKMTSNPLAQFAYIRATMGATRVDDQWLRNWTEAKRVGLPRGAYHYFVISEPGVAQARNFMDTLNGDIGERRPVLDLEPRKLENGQYEQSASKARLGEEVKHWIDAVQSATGKAPIIYTNRWALEWLTDSPAWMGSYDLWVAAYRAARPTNEMLPAPWAARGWAGWQFSCTGKMAGIDAAVDLNIWKQEQG